MKKKLLGLVIFSVLAVLVLNAMAQPPVERDQGPPKGTPEPGKKGPPRPGFGNFPPPRFQLGKILPPHVRDELELTDEQERQILDLELEVKGRMLKILSAEQRKQLKEMRAQGAPPPPPQPGGPPPRGKGPRGEEGADFSNRPRANW